MCLGAIRIYDPQSYYSSALGQCSNGLERLMHSPNALSHLDRYYIALVH